MPSLRSRKEVRLERRWVRSWRVTRRLLADPELHSTYLYLPGLDILRHRLERRRASEAVADLLQVQAALEAYLAALDEIVQEIVAARQGGSLVLVEVTVSEADAGFGPDFADEAAPRAEPITVTLRQLMRLREEDVEDFEADTLLDGLPAEEPLP